MRRFFAVVLGILLMGSLMAGCAQKTGVEAQTVPAAVETTEVEQAGQVFTITETGLVIQKTPVTMTGYVLRDGGSAPVTVTIGIDGVLTGQAAYESLVYQDPEIPAAPQGQEYLLALLTVTYEEGTLESIALERNQSTMEAARFYFSLSNGEDNAQDVSDSLNNSLYDQTIWEGDSVGAAVAFLQKAGNTQPLVFSGFGHTVAFAKEASIVEQKEENADREQAEKLEAFALDFMNAYICGDVARMEAYLMEIPTADPQVYDGLDFLVQVVPISAWESWAQELSSKGECQVSIPFKCDPLDDYYTYLTIAIANQNGTPKVIWYGLEG